MSYIEIVNLIFTIITTILSVSVAYYFIYSIIGFFTKKKYPKSTEKKKYGIIISARNEESVIGNLIDSIRKNDYPQENLTIFVIAHNCTDNTAKVAREHGAIVYEYNNDNERTKGYALKFLVDAIKKDYDLLENDGYFMFDADNILSPEYISKMNDAFVYFKGEHVITSFRNSKNFGKNLLSGMYGIFFMNGCIFESRGRTICGCSSRVQGTGFLIPSKTLIDGWNYVTLTEDWEFSADQILKGKKIMYCDEANFYDEQPTSLKVMFRQRLRWSKGHLLVCLTRTKQLFKSLFKRKNKDETSSVKFSKYDIMMSIMPIYVIYVAIFLIQHILLAFAPLVQTVDAGKFWLDWLINNAWSLLFSYLGLVVVSALVFILERKRIKGVSFIKKVGICLLYPLFFAVTIPIDIVALFSKNVGWKTIPHNDTTSFDELHGEVKN